MMGKTWKGALRDVVRGKLLEVMGIKILVPKKGVLQAQFRQVTEPICDETDGKWYCKGETFDVHGPFETENAAKDHRRPNWHSDWHQRLTDLQLGCWTGHYSYRQYR